MQSNIKSEFRQQIKYIFMTHSQKILKSTGYFLIIAVLTLAKEAVSAATYYEYKVL
jgi:hypothetical protein